MHVSFCTHGRNDNFMGDFLWRLNTTIAVLADSLSEQDAGWTDDQISFTDWGSDVPITLPLGFLARTRTKSFYVPPAAAARHGNVPFNTSAARNVAIRRAAGDWIVSMDSDILVPCAEMRSLLTQLECSPGDEIFVSPRRQLPHWFVRRRPSVGDIYLYLRTNGPHMRVDLLGHGYGAPAGIIAMRREHWHALHGFDETLQHWGWMDVDLPLRASQRYSLRVLDRCLPVHLEHYRQKRTTENICEEGRPLNACNDTAPFAANDENWGLRDEPVEQFEIGSPEDTSEFLPVTSVYRRTLVDTIKEQAQTWQDAVRIYSEMWGVWRYAEIGYQSAEYAEEVAIQSPGCELYLVTNWRELPKSDTTYSFAYGTDAVLRHARHCGATRIITDHATDAWRRQLPGPVDIVVAHGSGFQLPPMSAHGVVLMILADGGFQVL